MKLDCGRRARWRRGGRACAPAGPPAAPVHPPRRPAVPPSGDGRRTDAPTPPAPREALGGRPVRPCARAGSSGGGCGRAPARPPAAASGRRESASRRSRPASRASASTTHSASSGCRSGQVRTAVQQRAEQPRRVAVGERPGEQGAGCGGEVGQRGDPAGEPAQFDGAVPGPGHHRAVGRPAFAGGAHPLFAGGAPGPRDGPADSGVRPPACWRRRAARPTRPSSPLPYGRSRSARSPIRPAGRAPVGASAARPAPAGSRPTGARVPDRGACGGRRRPAVCARAPASWIRCSAVAAAGKETGAGALPALGTGCVGIGCSSGVGTGILPLARRPQGDNRTCHHSDDMIQGERGAAHRRNTEKLPRLIGGVRNSDAHRSVPRARPPHAAVPGRERQSAPAVRESGGRPPVRCRASPSGPRTRAPPSGGRPGRVRHRSRTQHPRRPGGTPRGGRRHPARPAQRAATGLPRDLAGHHPRRPGRSRGGRTWPPAARTRRGRPQHHRRRSRTHADQLPSPLSSRGGAVPSTAGGPREGKSASPPAAGPLVRRTRSPSARSPEM